MSHQHSCTRNAQHVSTQNQYDDRASCVLEYHPDMQYQCTRSKFQKLLARLRFRARKHTRYTENCQTQHKPTKHCNDKNACVASPPMFASQQEAACCTCSAMRHTVPGCALRCCCTTLSSHSSISSNTTAHPQPVEARNQAEQQASHHGQQHMTGAANPATLGLKMLKKLNGQARCVQAV